MRKEGLTNRGDRMIEGDQIVEREGKEEGITGGEKKMMIGGNISGGAGTEAGSSQEGGDDSF